MDFKLLTICIIVGAMPLAAAFNCYICTDVKTDSILPIFSQYKEDPVCRDGDTTKMTSFTCASGSACIKTAITISGAVSGSAYSADVTVRACLNIEAGSEAASKIGAIPGVTYISGDSCICSSENCICNGQSMPVPAMFTFITSLVMVIYISM